MREGTKGDGESALKLKGRLLVRKKPRIFCLKHGFSLFCFLSFSLSLSFKRRCTLQRQRSSPSRPTRRRSPLLRVLLLLLVLPPTPPPPPRPLSCFAAIPSRFRSLPLLSQTPPRSSPGSSRGRMIPEARRSLPPGETPAAAEREQRRRTAVAVAAPPAT